MQKRLSVFAVVAMTLPLVVAAGPASAQQVERQGTAQQAPPADRPCGSNYTNGQRYSLSTNPQPVAGAGRQGQTAVRVARNAEVRLTSRLLTSAASGTGPQKPCPGQRVTIVAGSANSRFTAVNRNRVTDSRGAVYGSKRATSDFRFFSRYNINGSTIGAQTPTTLVQVR